MVPMLARKKFVEGSSSHLDSRTVIAMTPANANCAYSDRRKSPPNGNRAVIEIASSVPKKRCICAHSMISIGDFRGSGSTNERVRSKPIQRYHQSASYRGTNREVGERFAEFLRN